MSNNRQNNHESDVQTEPNKQDNAQDNHTSNAQKLPDQTDKSPQLNNNDLDDVAAGHDPFPPHSPKPHYTW